MLFLFFVPNIIVKTAPEQVICLKPETTPWFPRFTRGILADGKKVLFAPIFDPNLLWGSAIFSNFYQLFPLTCVFLPCLGEKDVSANSRGLLSTILRRVCFDTWRSISLCKIKMRQFFWNLSWFQISAESVSVKLLWFHRSIDHLGDFFLSPGFMGPK